MLCRPSTAKRCIESFRGGSVLFLPLDYHQQQVLSRYDCAGGVLNLWTYYALVLVSFTGLLTLLGRTTVRQASEDCGDGPSMRLSDDDDKGDSNYLTSNSSSVVLSSHHDDKLVVRRSVFEYICRQQHYDTRTTEFQVMRRFDFSFGRFLSVLMLHVQAQDIMSTTGSDDRLHLVEVYRVEHPLLRRIYGHVFAAMEWVLQRVSRRWPKQTMMAS